MIKKRSANVLIFNSKHELALQLRAANDDSYPSHWDFSAAGGIDSGEEPEASASRELREEIGVNANLTFVTERLCEFPAWGTSEPREDYVYLYKAHHDGDFSIDSNEVQAIRFFTIDEIDSMMKSGEKFHPEFKYFWDEGIILSASKD